MTLVIVQFVDGLRLLQPDTDISQELFSFRHGLGHGCNPGVAGLVGTDHGRVTAIDDLEGHVLERRLERRVVDELGPWKPTYPLPRTIPGKAVEVHDDDLVRDLCLYV